MSARLAHPEPLSPAAAPVLVLSLLLIVAIFVDGAFDVRYWAPLALLAITALIGAQITGGLRIGGSFLLVAVIAIWLFAAWTMLSATWADSPARAWEGADRTILYASLVTVAAAVVDRRQALLVGSAIVTALAAIAGVLLVALWVDGPDLFLAGRLDDPIGYRNGTAVIFALAVWPLVGVAAERSSSPALRSAATGAAALCLGLAFLTQSRGVALGLVAGGIVALAIGPDRLRRAWIVVAALAGLALCSGWLLAPFHAFEDSGAAADTDVDRAALGLTVLTVLALAGGLVYALLDNGLRLTERSNELARRVAAGALTVIGVAAVAAALVAIGNPFSYAGDKWDEFTDAEASTTSGETRLTSVGGQRYDVWRVAWSEFEADPVGGVGEGNYLFGYYRERRTDRNLSDAHGIPFSVAAETGIVGTLLFGAFLVSLGLAIARSARSASPRERRVVAGVAAAGTVVIAQSMLDWFWLIPSIMGLGLLALTLAAVPGDPEEKAGGNRPASSFGRLADAMGGRVARLGSAALLVVAALSVAFLFLASFYTRKARSEIGESAQAQLSAARTAGDLNPVSVVPLYLEASALETQGDRAAARDVLLDALDKEPDNFTTLAVLGDLEVRAGRDRAAGAYYRRASELNPRDTGLRELAAGGGG